MPKYMPRPPLWLVPGRHRKKTKWFSVSFGGWFESQNSNLEEKNWCSRPTSHGAMVQAPKKAPRDAAKRAKLWPCGMGKTKLPFWKPEVEDFWINSISLLNHGNDLFDLDLSVFRSNLYVFRYLDLSIYIYRDLFILLSIYEDLNINSHMYIYVYYLSIYLSTYLPISVVTNRSKPQHCWSRSIHFKDVRWSCDLTWGFLIFLVSVCTCPEGTWMENTTRKSF